MEEKTVLTLDELSERYGALEYYQPALHSAIMDDFGLTAANNTVKMLDDAAENGVDLMDLKRGCQVMYDAKAYFKDMLDDNDFGELDVYLEGIQDFNRKGYDNADNIFGEDDGIFDDPMDVSELVEYLKGVQ